MKIRTDVTKSQQDLMESRDSSSGLTLTVTRRILRHQARQQTGPTRTSELSTLLVSRNTTWTGHGSRM